VEPTRIYGAADASAFLADVGLVPEADAADIDGAFMSAFIRRTRGPVAAVPASR